MPKPDPDTKVPVGVASSSSEDANVARVWPPWMPKYKDIIEVVAVVLGVIVAIWTLFSIDDQASSIREQNRAIVEQTEALRSNITAILDQTEAIADASAVQEKSTSASLLLFSEQNRLIREQLAILIEQNRIAGQQVQETQFENRPEITFKPFVPEDVISGINLPFLPNNRLAPPDSAEYYVMHYGLQNIGKSAALIDSVNYLVIDTCLPGKVMSIESPESARQMFSPGVKVINQLPYSLSPKCETMFCIRVFYGWQRSAGAKEKWQAVKCGRTIFENGAWHVYMVTQTTFENSLAGLVGPILK